MAQPRNNRPSATSPAPIGRIQATQSLHPLVHRKGSPARQYLSATRSSNGFTAADDYLCAFLPTVWILRLCERRNFLLTAISATLCFAAARPVLILPWWFLRRIIPTSDHGPLKFAPGWLDDCTQVVLLAFTLWFAVRVSLWAESRQSPTASTAP